MIRMKSMIMATLCLAAVAQAETVTLADFTDGKAHDWIRNPQVKEIIPTAEGLKVLHDGMPDPWIESKAPVPALPAGDYEKIRITIKLKYTGGSLEVFFGPWFKAENAITLKTSGTGEWETVSSIMPRLPEGSRLRLDPTSDGKELVVATITAEPLLTLYKLKFPQPKPVEPTAQAVMLTAGSTVLRHHPARWDAFTVECDGVCMAEGHDRPQLVWSPDGQKASVVELANQPAKVRREGEALLVELTVRDEGGATWRLERRFAPRGNGVEGLDVTTTLTPDQDRRILHAPWLTLFPGLGSYGAAKTQALLAGVEYLGDEESSSERDVRGLLAQRWMVDDVKLCFPLMAILSQGKVLSLSWDKSRYPATLFDTPDRLFNSGANLFALWAPGMHEGRLENDRSLYEAILWKANVPQTLRATITTVAKAESVLPAVDWYLRQQGMAELPKFDGGFQAAVTLMARGWLDSASYVDGKFRHAWVPGNGFGPQPVYDAVVFTRWLASQTTDAALAARLRARAEDFLAEVVKRNDYNLGVAHGRSAVYQFMLAGHTDWYVNGSMKGAMSGLKSVRPDGTIKFYKPANKKEDYGSTHWADHANGLTTGNLQGVINLAQVSANPEFRQLFLETADRILAQYRNDVPRGAQTWEMPLHTPDILGSAYMMRLASTCYRLTGEARYLQEAHYWALSGVPFVYLVAPVPELKNPGSYATIAVLGATNWVAPYWIGLPVQWCGLVYRNDLLNYIADLEDHPDVLPDTAHWLPIWRNIAHGITLAGLQFSWQDGDEEKLIGLLPDGYALKRCGKGGPAINPGTVQMHMAEAFGKTPMLQSRGVRPGVLVHALGGITVKGANAVSLDLWSDGETLITGIGEPAVVLWNGKPAEFTWLPEHRVTVVRGLTGKGTLEFREKQ